MFRLLSEPDSETLSFSPEFTWKHIVHWEKSGDSVGSSLVRRCRLVPPASLWADDWLWNPLKLTKDGCKCCPSAFGKMDEQDFRPDSQLNSKLRCGDHCTQNLSLLYDQLYLQPFRLVKKFKCPLKESLDTLWMMICSIMGGFWVPHHSCWKLFYKHFIHLQRLLSEAEIISDRSYKFGGKQTAVWQFRWAFGKG